MKLKSKVKKSITNTKSVAFESPKKAERRRTTVEISSSHSPVHVGSSSSAPPKGIINAGRGSSAWSPIRSSWPGIRRDEITSGDMPDTSMIISNNLALDDSMVGKQRRSVGSGAGGGGGGGGSIGGSGSVAKARGYSALVPVESSFSSEGLMSLLAKADKGIGELLAAAESEENSRSNL